MSSQGWEPYEVFDVKKCKLVLDEEGENFMLILTRRIGEKIRIGSDIEMAILGVKGGQVRIGVNAPKDISVHREEIFQRIQAEKIATVDNCVGADD